MQEGAPTSPVSGAAPPDKMPESGSRLGRLWRRIVGDRRWSDEAWALAPVGPISAIAFTVIVYLLPGAETAPPGAPVITGLALAVVLFVICLFLAHNGAGTDRIQRSLAEIRPRVTRARAAYESLGDAGTPSGNPNVSAPDAAMARAIARDQV